MNTFALVLMVLAIALALACLPALWRMVVGPTILDRVVAMDMFITCLVMGLALYSLWTRTAYALPVMLGLTGFAFIGSIAVARFTGRERGPDGSQLVSGPSTTAGAQGHNLTPQRLDQTPAPRPEGDQR
ncbi:monovalent cation/H+ antiporter complex subunit F [Devriesea agamarum]|uniref:monovalent cation/H+ antiporter complex subunit F n=1 Tax=Devriesea agamarum TaxID=472569 RepID=UPI00071E4777|nr:monovalent cation/H+ antiporter complex subunit F [Devriesea agamarum]